MCLNTGTPAAEAIISPQSRTRQILIAEPEAAYRELLAHIAGPEAEIVLVGEFQEAYARLSSGSFDLLVTNLRLDNNVEGLHLAYVAASSRFATRAVVYSEELEPWVAHELQRAGAFYEIQSRMVFALPAYVQAELPVLDRRSPALPDRRTVYRGGRRASDVPMTLSR